MINIFISFLLLALPLLTQAVPPSRRPWGHTPHFFRNASWANSTFPGSHVPCTNATMKVRVDFDSMAPQERKAYTDAIRCLMTKPSQLNQTLYPAAINRYFDYAVIHTNLTQQIHISGFFLTWHRYYLHLFEQDLAQQCGYTGAFPYWNWPATADNLSGSAIFDGSEYSMSGDGAYTNNDSIVLSPFFSIPHGSGGGCVTSGPFANLTVTMQPISIDTLITGSPLPANAFARNESCLTRDLNTYVAKRYANISALYECLETTDMAIFTQQINGVIGSTELGLHSGAHFVVGSPGSNIFVSVQDPIWWPLHTFLDNLYTSWQARHPEMANAVYGTLTANNAPPSANASIDTVEPGWGYFDQTPYTIGDLMSTTSGPFCYRYDVSL